MNFINELWHGNIVPQDDSRNNSREMKQLMEYMARHHDDLLKSMRERGLIERVGGKKNGSWVIK